MSAFIHALHETNMAGVLRYVWQNNSQPKLTAIVPHIKADCEDERLCARDCEIHFEVERWYKSMRVQSVFKASS